MWIPIKTDEIKKSRYQIWKSPGAIIIFFITIMLIIGFPELFFSYNSKFLNLFLPTITSVFVGLSAAIFLVDYIIARNKRQKNIAEIWQILLTGMNKSNLLLEAVESELKNNNQESLENLVQNWIESERDINSIPTAESRTILKYLLTNKNDYNELLKYESIRCRDLGISFSHKLQPTETAAISQHSYTLRTLRDAIHDTKPDFEFIICHFFNLYNNYHVLENEFSQQM